MYPVDYRLVQPKLVSIKEGETHQSVTRVLRNPAIVQPSLYDHNGERGLLSTALGRFSRSRKTSAWDIVRLNHLQGVKGGHCELFEIAFWVGV